MISLGPVHVAVLERQRHGIDAVPLVRGGVVLLALEDVPEMAAAGGAHYLGALHTP